MPRQDLIQPRRGTAAQWASANPTLAEGEQGYETDTGKFKIGNGSAQWSVLDYQPATGEVVIGPDVGSATDGQTTTITDGELKAHDPLWIDMTQAPYNIKFDRLTSTGGSMSSVTNPTHLALLDYTFTSLDIGKKVKVVGAAAGGANLKTTITGISAGKAVLASPCLTTVAAAFVIVCTDNIVGLTALSDDLSLSAARGLSRIAMAPHGCAGYTGTWELPARGTIQGSCGSWVEYDLMYSRSGGAELRNGTIFYQLWDQNVDCARVHTVTPTQYDWNGTLRGFAIHQDRDNTAGSGLVFKNAAGTAVKVIDGGTIDRFAVMGAARIGIHFAGGTITAGFRDLYAFACGWHGRKEFTADTSTSTNPTVLTNVSSTAGLAVDDLVAGPGIPLNATIKAIGASTITLSRPAEADGVGVAVERLGDPGIWHDVNNSDMATYYSPSGDANSGGLVRFRGFGTASEASVTVIGFKNEFGVNPHRGGTYTPATTPSVPQGRNAIVLDRMQNTPVEVIGGTHWADANSSVGGTLPNPLGTHIGAAIVNVGNGPAPKVTWRGMRVRLASGSGQTTRIAFHDNWSSTLPQIASDATGSGTNKPAGRALRTTTATATLTTQDANGVVGWTGLPVSRTATLRPASEFADGTEIVLRDFSGLAAPALKIIAAADAGDPAIVGTTEITSAYGALSLTLASGTWYGRPA